MVKQGVKGRTHLPHFRGRTQVIKAYAALNLYLTAIHRLRSYLTGGSCHAPQGLQKPRHQAKADHRRQNYTAAHQQHLDYHLAADQGLIVGQRNPGKYGVGANRVARNQYPVGAQPLHIHRERLGFT